MQPVSGLRIPLQSPPVSRHLVSAQGPSDEAGLEPAQTVCDNLTGLSQQMCYAVQYGVST